MNVFLRPGPPPGAQLRLIVFHHAGGSAAAYYPLARKLPPEWDVLLLDLPGRGRRAAAPPIGAMPELIEQVCTDIDPWLTDMPVALFGHSLGAVVALESARWMCDESVGMPPVWVGVSGRIAPGFQALSRRKLYELDDEALLDTLIGMGGTPEQVRRVPEIRDRLLNTVRADLRAADTYQPRPDRSPLSVPITAFSGDRDGWAPPASMPAWARETSAEFAHFTFTGGHFYFLEDAFAAIGRRIGESVGALVVPSGV
ncbi:MAG TPA: alpha/beta fold hydrolase [Actinocrinis sp.]|jgi:surfactin synthase thioesterase subunit